MMNKFNRAIYLSVIFAVFLNEVTAKPQHPAVGIIHGSTAEDGEFPYMVQLLDNYGIFVCAGVIIGDKWVLTAGQCLRNTYNDRVVYGSNYWDEDNYPTNTTMKIKKEYLHPQFVYNYSIPNMRYPYFDIGIMELEGTIPFDAKAQPIKLADSNAEIPIETMGVLTGWGVDNADPRYIRPMSNLQKINMQLLNDTECTQKMNEYAKQEIFNSSNNLCLDQYYSGACGGDGGDPFVINGTMYGIVSWSLLPCGQSPAALARLDLPAHREFIRNVTGI